MRKNENANVTGNNAYEAIVSNINQNLDAETKASNIGELRGLLAPARAQGMTVAIIKIPVRLFTIDTRYQTKIRTDRELTYLTRNFDDRKLLPVVGVPHDEEGLIYLVDGYGRWKASQIVNAVKYETLMCQVILDAPKDAMERLKFEAELYAFQNKNVKKVTPLQKHGAFEVMEDKTALILDELKQRYGFTFASEKGNREGGVIGSYTNAYEICRVNGRECLEYILDVCDTSRFNMKYNGYSTYMFRALRDLWKLYPENREETKKFISEYLRPYSPVGFKAKAVSKYDMLDGLMSVSLYMEDLAIEALNLNRKRTLMGKRVVLNNVKPVEGTGTENI